MLQKELAEAKSNLEDLQYEKEEAERKIAELNSTISNLEHDKTRNHTFDTSEFKVSLAVCILCLCVCVYTIVYVCMCVYMYVHVCVRLFVCCVGQRVTAKVGI